MSPPNEAPASSPGRPVAGDPVSGRGVLLTGYGAPAEWLARATAAILLMRPRQWVKNLFIFAPLLVTPEAVSLRNLAKAGAVFAVFCIISSAVYIINDILDREADRLHPVKRHRPLASGALPVSFAWGLLAAALVALTGAAAFLAPFFLASGVLWVAVTYAALNLIYSLRLKHVPILDVMTIAIGFVMRIIAGALAVAASASPWLLEYVGLVALFLALAKRRDDLVLALPSSHRPSMRGYSKIYLDICIAIVLSSLLAIYIVYSATSEVTARLGTDKLYYTLPFVVAGILRYLQVTIVEERSGSPTDMVVTDSFILSCLGGWFIVFLLLVY